MKMYNIIILILLLLNFVDYDTTVRIIKSGGSEANPIVNYVIITTGAMWPVLAIKLFFVGTIWWGFSTFDNVTTFTITLLTIVTLIYTGVVVRSVKFCFENGLF